MKAEAATAAGKKINAHDPAAPALTKTNSDFIHPLELPHTEKYFQEKIDRLILSRESYLQHLKMQGDYPPN